MNHFLGLVNLSENLRNPYIPTLRNVGDNEFEILKLTDDITIFFTSPGIPPNLKIATCKEWLVFALGTFMFSKDPLENISDPTIEILQQLKDNKSIPEILNCLDGQFCIIIFNKINKTAYLAVDRIGIFKLYYKLVSDGLIISTHPKLIADYTGSKKINPESVYLFLALRGVPAPYSIFMGINKVRPSYYLSINEKECEEYEYWPSEKYIHATYEKDFRTAQSQFLDLLRDEVARVTINRINSTIGIFLSGGLDSAILASILTNLHKDVHAFSIGYKENQRNDETKDASDTAKLLNLPLEIIKPCHYDYIDLLEGVVTHLPEPVGDASFLPQLFLTKFAQRETDILLDGTGADNIFGGLSKIKANYFAERYSRLPISFRRKIISPLVNSFPTSRKWQITNWFRLVQKFCEGADYSGYLRDVYWTRFIDAKNVRKIINSHIAPENDIASEFLVNSLLPEFPEEKRLLPTTLMSMRGIMPWGSLHKLNIIQNITGAHIPLPFLSKDIVEFGLSLPDDYKFFKGTTKYILREATRMGLQKNLSQRKKGNFTPPVGVWLQEGFKDLFWSTIEKSEILNVDWIKVLFEEQKSNKRDWQLELWAIFMLQTWMSRNNLSV